MSEPIDWEERSIEAQNRSHAWLDAARRLGVAAEEIELVQCALDDLDESDLASDLDSTRATLIALAQKFAQEGSPSV